MLTALLLSLAQAPAGATTSLEAYLAALRARTEQRLAALAPDVDLALERLAEAIAAKRRPALDEARRALAALDPGAAPLLARRLDPGPDADAPARELAREVARALAAAPAAPIGDLLRETASTGSREGRLNALTVMATSEDRAGFDDVLAGLYAEEDQELKAAALAGMARLGGSANDERLRAALAEAKPPLVAIALAALRDARADTAAPAVLALVRAQERAKHNVAGIADYYRACPAVLDATHARALVDLAGDETLAAKDRVSLLELLPSHPEALDEPLLERLRGMARGVNKDVREAALVALTALGDRGAKKDLLAPYNRQVEQSRDWSKGYESRGLVLYRIGEYREAIRDFREALRLGPVDPRGDQKDAHVGLARCYAVTGKLKEAYQVLRTSPLDEAELRALATDPAFARLLESDKYKDIFGV